MLLVVALLASIFAWRNAVSKIAREERYSEISDLQNAIYYRTHFGSATDDDTEIAAMRKRIELLKK